METLPQPTRRGGVAGIANDFTGRTTRPRRRRNGARRGGVIVLILAAGFKYPRPRHRQRPRVVDDPEHVQVCPRAIRDRPRDPAVHRNLATVGNYDFVHSHISRHRDGVAVENRDNTVRSGGSCARGHPCRAVPSLPSARIRPVSRGDRRTVVAATGGSTHDHPGLAAGLGAGIGGGEGDRLGIVIPGADGERAGGQGLGDVAKGSIAVAIKLPAARARHGDDPRTVRRHCVFVNILSGDGGGERGAGGLGRGSADDVMINCRRQDRAGADRRKGRVVVVAAVAVIGHSGRREGLAGAGGGGIKGLDETARVARNQSRRDRR